MKSGTASKMSDGQFRELVAALVRQIPDDLDSTLAQRWIDDQQSLRRVLRVALEPVVTCRSFRHDKTKDGWTLLQDVPQAITSGFFGLELVSFHKPNERNVSGELMASRAIELEANLGQHDAEYLLEHQNKIPAEFREYILVFTGTVWRDSDGDSWVSYFRWSSGLWLLGFHWLKDVVGSQCRLVRLGKSS